MCSAKRGSGAGLGCSETGSDAYLDPRRQFTQTRKALKPLPMLEARV
jgi:hypothetical protein